MATGSGRYDRRVEVSGYTVTQNAAREDVKAWTVLGKRWAKIERGSGSERREAAQERSSLPATVILRYSEFASQIQPQTHRLAFDGLEWDIESASEGTLGRRREIMIVARAAK